MPSMAAIVCKKADETTDQTLDALAPASGDGNQAQWRQDTGAAAGLPVGHRATMSMATQWNGPKTARRATVVFKKPYSLLNSTTNRYESQDAIVGRLEITVPQAIPASEINEAVYLFLNAVGKASGLVKQSVAAGYAPT